MPVEHEGIVRRDSKISGSVSLFVHPAVAATLGVVLGVCLTFVSHRASAFVTPENPHRGMLIVAAMTGARFFVAIAALAAFYAFAPAGLAPFGFALAVSFIAGLAFEAVKAVRIQTSRTSA